jgi:hypothetical protein
MSAPIVILCGNAGSGKDTVGSYLSHFYRGIDIALADPMKRMANEIFGFDFDQLWGPSANRNQVDHRFDCTGRGISTGDVLLGQAENRLEAVAKRWFPVLFPARNQAPIDQAFALWFGECVKKAEMDELTPRFVLQTLGTEFGRAQDPEVWSRYAVNTARLLLGAEHEYSRAQGLIRNPDKKRPFDLVTITDGRFANEITNVKMAGGVVVNLVRPEDLAKEAMKAGVADHASEMQLGLVPDHFYDYRIVNDSTIESLQAKASFLAHQVLRAPRVIGKS